MELHQLRYAVAVADHGTFTAAAQASFVAQPSLSHAVRTLERELGAPLFHRLGRHVALTAAGEAFLPAAREGRRGVGTVRAGVAAVVGLDTGHLDLGALPTLAVDPITPLVGAFRTAHPGVTVRLAHPEGTTELVELVRSGSSEIGVTELPVAAERITTLPLGRQELVAVLRRAARARSASSWPPGPPPLVTQRPGTSTRRRRRALATVGAEATVAVETDQRRRSCPGAGRAALGWCPGRWPPSPSATAPWWRPSAPLWRQLGLIHREAPLSPAAQAFIALAGGQGTAGAAAGPPSSPR
jgi:DNA-binding transcriptional LysR family regulator